MPFCPMGLGPSLAVSLSPSSLGRARRKCPVAMGKKGTPSLLVEFNGEPLPKKREKGHHWATESFYFDACRWEAGSIPRVDRSSNNRNISKHSTDERVARARPITHPTTPAHMLGLLSKQCWVQINKPALAILHGVWSVSHAPTFRLVGNRNSLGGTLTFCIYLQFLLERIGQRKVQHV